MDKENKTVETNNNVIDKMLHTDKTEPTKLVTESAFWALNNPNQKKS